jgi:type VI protein secretion system component Hcp
MAQVILEIPGVQGECELEGFAGMILCDSLAQDMEIEIEPTSNARRTVHIPKINNITMERKWDLASSGLIKSILTAKVDTNDWKIHCLKALGGDDTQQKEFLTIILKKPILAKHGLSVNEGDTTESLEINAVEVTWEYQAYDDSQNNIGQKAITFNTLTGKVV